MLPGKTWHPALTHDIHRALEQGRDGRSGCIAECFALAEMCAFSRIPWVGRIRMCGTEQTCPILKSTLVFQFQEDALVI